MQMTDGSAKILAGEIVMQSFRDWAYIKHKEHEAPERNTQRYGFATENELRGFFASEWFDLLRSHVLPSFNDAALRDLILHKIPEVPYHKMARREKHKKHKKRAPHRMVDGAERRGKIL